MSSDAQSGEFLQEEGFFDVFPSNVLLRASRIGAEYYK
jgi:hypothetical protein